MKNALLATTAATPITPGGTTTVTESGAFVSYSVTQTGTYTITADGAQGGSSRAGGGTDAGGMGAQIVGTFALTAGETIRIAVGQAGGNAMPTSKAAGANQYGGGGGGGGTWVELVNGGSTTLLEVAGGGGGSTDYYSGGAGSVGTPGSGNGGYAVRGALATYVGGGGGGDLSNGNVYGDGSYKQAGKAGKGLASGLAGGAAGTGNIAYGRSGAGGFGGGGGASSYVQGTGAGGGGGGGFTGGDAGSNQASTQAGQGGTSYVAGSGTLVSQTAGFETGNGLVTITEQACFASGTRIETEAGPVPVENLREGDYVRLAREDAFVPVVWMGHRTVDCARHPRPDAVMPVRVRAGAFGPGQPARDLILSPDHAVFADGVLIPVRHLLNGATIVRETRATITYWHVELERHDVLLAEGLPCESYLDTGNRAAFANAGPVVSAWPQFDPVRAMDVWAADACAPLVTGGIERDAVHDLLLARAADLGHETTGDPAVSLLVDGRTVRPDNVGGALRFELPEGAKDVRLRSRTFVPAEMSATARDHRALGIAVSDIRIDGVTAGPNAFGHAEGWFATEAGHHEAWRWTDGDAALHCPGARTIEIATGPRGLYWQVPVTAPATGLAFA